MRFQDKTMDLALGIGALIPGSAIATAAPLFTGSVIIAAGTAYTLAFLFGEGACDRHYRTVLSALLLPGIVGATVLQQIEVAEAAQNTYAGLVLLIVGVALALSRGVLSLPVLFSGGGRRLLSAPWIVLLAASFSSVLNFAAGKALGGEDLGLVLFVFLGVLPMLFGFFIVGAAKLIDEAEVSQGRWVARYLVAVSSALLSAVVLGSILQR